MIIAVESGHRIEFPVFHMSELFVENGPQVITAVAVIVAGLVGTAGGIFGSWMQRRTSRDDRRSELALLEEEAYAAYSSAVLAKVLSARRLGESLRASDHPSAGQDLVAAVRDADQAERVARALVLVRVDESTRAALFNLIDAVEDYYTDIALMKDPDAAEAQSDALIFADASFSDAANTRLRDLRIGR